MGLADKDILIIDWETKELPKLATPFLDHFVLNYFSAIVNYEKQRDVNRIKSSTKFNFLYNNRKDFKSELDLLGDFKLNVNVKNVIALASKLKLALPKSNRNHHNENLYEVKFNKIIDIHYPLMQMLDYRAYEGKAAKHLKDYISAGDQEIFKNCLK